MQVVRFAAPDVRKMETIPVIFQGDFLNAKIDPNI